MVAQHGIARILRHALIDGRPQLGSDADHWRRAERERRGLRLVDGEPAGVDDPWEVVVERIRAREVLDRLGAHHRAALTLRYLDGLPVPEVARHLDRTVHATEALLVRARAAFRRIYEEEEGSR